MKNLIVVRHGTCYTSEDDGGLTSKGDEQVRRLGNFMKKNLEGGFHICYSPLFRTRQSALVLSSILGAGIECLYELNCEHDNLFHWQAEDIHKRVTERQDEADNLVLVSHFAIRDYAEHYMRECGFDMWLKMGRLAMGRGIQLDCESKTKRIIPCRGYKR